MKLGVIGGLGPMATAHFMELVINMTKAGCDQEHLEMIIYNCPQIPDRTSYILGKSDENPLPKMLEIGKALKDQGADIIAIPCMTAHYFHEELNEQIGASVLHGIKLTAQTLKSAGVLRVGIMATDGTISSQIFQSAVEELGMEAVIPEPEYQQKVMKIIYEDIKAGVIPPVEEFMEIKDYLVKDKGVQAIVLGCTELSLIKKAYDLGDGIIDTLEVLASASVLACNKELNPAYTTLVKPIDN